MPVCFGRGTKTRTLDTRFWSGCGEAHRGAGEGQCWTVPAASHKTGGAGLVLREILGAKTSEKERKIPGKAGNTLA